MTRSFTKREKVMLVILALIVIVCAYYMLVWQPADEAIAAAEIRVEDADTEIEIETQKAISLAEMRAELEGVVESGDEPSSEIPEYDNIGGVMQVLNGVLADTIDYDLTFQPVLFEGWTARRVINMNFTCEEYAAARRIITELYGSRYRCQIGAIAIAASDQGTDTPDINTGKVAVSMVITFFESN